MLHLTLFAILLVSPALADCRMHKPHKCGAMAEQKAQPAMPTDPVCGMQIDPAKATAKSDYKGKTYYFCCNGCKKSFDANPDSFLNKDNKPK